MASSPRGPQPPKRAPGSPERGSPRARLPIPVRARIGQAPSRQSRLHDVSVSGFRIAWTAEAEVDDAVVARFDGYPGVCAAFLLQGRVVRVIAGKEPGLGVAIDRAGCSPEALEQFRRLVLHYMRHRPLLDELARDFFEGRCEACDWIGRVGARAPVCPRCGERVQALDPDQ